MLGVSLLSPATSFARSAVEANVRIAALEQVVERATAPNGRATDSRIAIVWVGKVVGLHVQRVRAKSGDDVVDAAKLERQRHAWSKGALVMSAAIRFSASWHLA
jgi:hypothetical protein